MERSFFLVVLPTFSGQISGVQLGSHPCLSQESGLRKSSAPIGQSKVLWTRSREGGILQDAWQADLVTSPLIASSLVTGALDVTGCHCCLWTTLLSLEAVEEDGAESMGGSACPLLAHKAVNTWNAAGMNFRPVAAC